MAELEIHTKTNIDGETYEVATIEIDLCPSQIKVMDGWVARREWGYEDRSDFIRCALNELFMELRWQEQAKKRMKRHTERMKKSIRHEEVPTSG